MLYQQTPTQDLYKPLIAIIQTQEKPKEAPKPKEPSLEEKIASNYYKCDTLTQWIWAQDATCHDKLLPESQNVAVAPVRGSGGGSGSGNTYFAGQCTAFVKDQLPWVNNGWGNASDWKYTSGHRVSAIPAVGTIAWAKGYGHVAVVIAVGNGTVTVQEQNYKGPFIVSTRVAPISEFEYIYP